MLSFFRSIYTITSADIWKPSGFLNNLLTMNQESFPYFNYYDFLYLFSFLFKKDLLQYNEHSS